MAETSFEGARSGKGPRAGKLVSYAGAAMSLALVVGIGVWGYKLLVRDATGVPVVRAMEGPMRSAPENPGGEIALHTGLSVNAVPAQGGVAPPEDTLVLAPAQPALPQEDLEITPSAEARELAPKDPLGTVVEGEVAAVAEAAETASPVDPDTPLTVEEVLALADQIAAAAAPMTDLEAGEDVPVAVAVAGVAQVETPAPTASPVATTVAGVARSLRPRVRPNGGFAAAVVTPA
ncbi:MAG: sporulation protein, partial [Thalassobium sp.]